MCMEEFMMHIKNICKLNTTFKYHFAFSSLGIWNYQDFTYSGRCALVASGTRFQFPHSLCPLFIPLDLVDLNGAATFSPPLLGMCGARGAVCD